MTRRVAGGIRDMSSCFPDAGAVPCDLVDMTDVATPGAFYVKVKKLSEAVFEKQCNKVSFVSNLVFSQP